MGEPGKGARAEVLFSRKWESLALVHLTPAFKKCRGQVYQARAFRLPTGAFGLSKSVSLRVSY